MEPVRILRGKYLLRIGRRYGSYRVGADYCALHKINIAAELHYFALGFGYSEHVSENIHAENALVLYVVNREDRLYAAVPCLPAVHTFKIYDRKRRLPVMSVNDIRKETDKRKQIDRRLAEKCEPLAVVVFAVKPSAAEIVFVIHEIEGNAVFDDTEKAAVLFSPRKGYTGIEKLFHLTAVSVGYRIVQRHYYPYVTVRIRLAHGCGKRPYNIAEPSRRGKGKRLACDKKYTFHYLPLSVPECVLTDTNVRRSDFSLCRTAVSRSRTTPFRRV